MNRSGSEEENDPLDLQHGDRVQIKDLFARSDLNGRVGNVVAFDANSWRYKVDMDDGAHMAFGPKNLEGLGDDAEEGPAADPYPGQALLIGASRVFPSVEALFNDSDAPSPPRTVVLLCGLASPKRVGAHLRTLHLMGGDAAIVAWPDGDGGGDSAASSPPRGGRQPAGNSSGGGGAAFQGGDRNVSNSPTRGRLLGRLRAALELSTALRHRWPMRIAGIPLAKSVEAVRFCESRGLRTFLVNDGPPGDGLGLAALPTRASPRESPGASSGEEVLDAGEGGASSPRLPGGTLSPASGLTGRAAWANLCLDASLQVQAAPSSAGAAGSGAAASPRAPRAAVAIEAANLTDAALFAFVGGEDAGRARADLNQSCQACVAVPMASGGGVAISGALLDSSTTLSLVLYERGVQLRARAAQELQRKKRLVKVKIRTPSQQRAGSKSQVRGRNHGDNPSDQGTPRVAGIGSLDPQKSTRRMKKPMKKALPESSSPGPETGTGEHSAWAASSARARARATRPASTRR